MLASAVLTSNEEGIVPILNNSINVKLGNKEGQTFNFKIKPYKLLAHVDMGIMNVENNGKKFTVNPYVFYAGNKDFNRSICGSGSIININNNLSFHVF